MKSEIVHRSEREFQKRTYEKGYEVKDRNVLYQFQMTGNIITNIVWKAQSPRFVLTSFPFRVVEHEVEVHNTGKQGKTTPFEGEKIVS